MAGTYVVVTAGRGPQECCVAAALVARAFVREAEAAGLSVASDLGEPQAARSVALVLGGEEAAAFLERWAGTVLWIDASVRQGRSRRNWYVAVRAVAEAPEAPALDPADVRIETMRAGGAGGQHQNKTESAVRAVHLPTGLTAVARSQRSQHRNRKAALERLAELVSASADPDRRAAMREAWLGRIEVERGAPVRTFRGRAMEEG